MRQKQDNNSKIKSPQLIPYQFKPGESGNPSGRPKGSFSITVQYRRFMSGKDLWALQALLAERDMEAGMGLDQKQKEFITKLCGHPKEAVLRLAGGTILRAQCSLHNVQEVTNRTDGKVPDIVHTQELLSETPDEKRAKLADIRRRLADLKDGKV
jgi:hypothetical protein